MFLDRVQRILADEGPMYLGFIPKSPGFWDVGTGFWPLHQPTVWLQTPGLKRFLKSMHVICVCTNAFVHVCTIGEDCIFRRGPAK